MARVKYGSLVTEVKGKIGGQILQAGNCSKIMRTKPNVSKFRNMISSDQNLMYQFLAYKWSLLTSEERESWSDKAPLYPFEDSFGDMFTGSPYNVYVFLNSGLYMLSEDLLVSCPDPEPAPEPFETSLSIDISAETCNFNFSPSPVPATCGIISRWFKRRKSNAAEIKDKVPIGIHPINKGFMTPDEMWDELDTFYRTYWKGVAVGDIVQMDYQTVLLSTGQRSARTTVIGVCAA